MYHTFLVDGESAGVVGYIPGVNTQGESIGFVQVAIAQVYRGRGLTKAAEDLLAKRYKLACLYATIDLKNTDSLIAHKKAGFTEFDKETINQLHSKGLLNENQTRMYKKYTAKAV
ncbi:MAG: hypothetical protein ACD_57C00253G0001 [uncultured bacterium]|nr:MAG: hypothetical protein ACD_57C00253G0001 [uncultured bacterium]